jgi:hypothetical protein
LCRYCREGIAVQFFHGNWWHPLPNPIEATAAECDARKIRQQQPATAQQGSAPRDF